MSVDQSERFKQTLAEIRRRWGSDALQPLSALRATAARISTGFPALDALLGGGIACGGVIELCGAPTSGITTLALRVIAGAQAQARLAVYVDLARVFDPGYAVRCGVRLEGLLIARPEDAAGGLDILHIVAAQGGAALAVLDSTAEVLAGSHDEARLGSALDRLIPALRQSGGTAVFLTPGALSGALADRAALRLQMENAGWIEGAHDVAGLRACISVLRNRGGRAGGQVEVPIVLEDFAQGDTA